MMAVRAQHFFPAFSQMGFRLPFPVPGLGPCSAESGMPCLFQSQRNASDLRHVAEGCSRAFLTPLQFLKDTTTQLRLPPLFLVPVLPSVPE